MAGLSEIRTLGSMERSLDDEKSPWSSFLYSRIWRANRHAIAFLHLFCFENAFSSFLRAPSAVFRFPSIHTLSTRSQRE
jgi:hypothetical protein